MTWQVVSQTEEQCWWAESRCLESCLLAPLWPRATSQFLAAALAAGLTLGERTGRRGTHGGVTHLFQRGWSVGQHLLPRHPRGSRDIHSGQSRGHWCLHARNLCRTTDGQGCTENRVETDTVSPEGAGRRAPRAGRS